MTLVEAYSRIAPVYDSTPNALRELERRTLTPLLPPLNGRMVVDVGAGTGRWLNHALANGGRTIAIDLSPQMLSAAPSPRILADGTKLPLCDDAADVVLCTFMFGYAPSCFAELARITRWGGTVVVTDVHPDAIARGWSRSFRVGDEVIEPAHHRYSIEALVHPSLTRTHLIVPHLGEPERSIFESSGKLALFEAAMAQPAIFVALWTKK